MNKDWLLIALIALGSALCWWPVIREPSLQFSRWIPLGLIALMALLATALTSGRWLGFVTAATAGSFFGLCSAQAMWPSDDGIANSYTVIVFPLVTLAVLILSLVACLAGRRLRVTNLSVRPVLWIALLACAAFGPIMMAITSPLVARRMARNDHLANERFAALKRALEATSAGVNGASQLCNGETLRLRYIGPPFSQGSWARMVGNFVKEDGYTFIVNCPGSGHYTLNAMPDQVKGFGTRRFCTDDSGNTAIGLARNEQQWGTAMNEQLLPHCPHSGPDRR